MSIVQEKEIYISNDRLCFLFNLLINNGAKIPCENKNIADNLIEDFNVFVAGIMETYLQTVPQYTQDQITRELQTMDSDDIPFQYNNWYEISYLAEDKILQISLKDSGKLLNDTLYRYIRLYIDDELSAWDNTNHFCSTKLYKDFYDKISNYNCKDLHIEDTEDILAIVLGYYQNYIRINKIICNIDLSPIDDMLFIPCYGYQQAVVTYFYCHIDAQKLKQKFNEFVKEEQIDRKHNNTTPLTRAFTKKQIHLLNLALERLKTAKEIITTDDIDRIYSTKREGNCTTPLNIRIANNISKINTSFKKATGKLLLEKQDGCFPCDTYDIIATIEDIQIAIKKNK